MQSVPKEFSARRDWPTGFTLLELIVSMLASTALVAGLSSTLFVATQIVDPPKSPNAATANAFMDLERILQDLRYAIRVHELSSHRLDVEVPDRDGDGSTERVRLVWSGGSGDPVTWEWNDEPAIPIVQDVHNWGVTRRMLETGEIVLLEMDLQVGSASYGRVQSQIDLPNRPEMVAN
ncbi:hypothetical protein [Thalassoroseus pseudoceratinae]|uniref:hypothetical protein n=1 Tax=Thalassoroseus pseudoceratinae TaxID=2713176 RepID=UPI00141FFC66|nr:hypothetical protein [Thalassoroseus pseudoceratinae]